MVKCYLSLGSNMGDREMNLIKAVRLLKLNEHIGNIEVSGIYETEPVGYVMQDYFYNICLSLETDLEPMELLDVCQMIEQEMKRVRTVRFGPRNIDVDILLYGDLKIDTERLIIPHERMFERAFVLVPLSELMEIKWKIPKDQSVKRLKDFVFEKTDR